MSDESLNLGGNESLRNVGSTLSVVGESGSGGGGGSGGDSGYTLQNPFTFGTVLHAVDDLGLDPTGGTDVSDTIENAVEGGDTLIKFPPGEYLWAGSTSDGPPCITPSGDKIGFQGTGDTKYDVRFTIPQGDYRLWRLEGSDYLVENLVFDQGGGFDRTIGTWFKLYGGTLEVLNVGAVGTEPSRNEVSGSNDLYMMWALNNYGGHIHFDGYESAMPVHFDDYPTNRALFWSQRGDYGSARFENMYIENGSGSVFYFGKEEMDPVVFENCTFKNCRDKVLRVSKRTTEVRNCSFIVDTSEEHPDNEAIGGGSNIRPLWGQSSSDPVVTGPTVRDCEFDIRQIGNGMTRAIAIQMDSDTGGARVDNCVIRQNADNAAIFAFSPDSGAGQPHEMELTNLAITGDGEAAAVDVNGRSGSYLEDSCIDMPNGGGVSGVSTSNITHSACRYPGDDSTVGDQTDSETGAGGGGGDTSYRTITVSSNSQRTYDLSGTESLENILFDCTATNATVSIRLRDDATLRNIGVKGQHDPRDSDYNGLVRIGGGTEGGTQTIDRLYVEGYNANGHGVICTRNHAGTLNAAGLAIHGMPDCGVFAGKSQATITISDSYLTNNRIANARLGGGYDSTADPTHRLETSVSVIDDMSNTALGPNDDDTTHGVLARYGTATVADCDVVFDETYEVDAFATQVDGTVVVDENTQFSPSDSYSGDVRLSSYGHNPDTTRPSYAPQDATDAASGTN